MLLQRVFDTVFTETVPAEGLSSSRRVRAVARLLALLGSILFIGLAIEGVTIVFIGQLIAVHVVLGMILLPIMAYKIIVASYRFAMYYLGASDFKHAGPPELVLRVIGPLLILTTVILMASGIILVYAKPNTPTAALWLNIHRDDFVAWFALMALHVLAYVRRAVGTSSYDLRYTRYHSLIGRQGRLISIVLATVIGVLLAWAIFPAVAHWSSFFSVHPTR
ncbi:hypothetical protein [Ferrimicrobium acidiphilum]|uniref:Cytochrome b561 bacterial/Ni-hydrogenase domain-containing protein n=1 Tax=Ferrimicrobium acidiphilum DSM 19497 TaxID=1121877 RepID=A0A0D8FR48_9ACTN|nr:hypothetical protein [Ferrimicrobium acidiphilum]KJE75730.1 hypothetical protein FEAC_25070 [Ferrimicrobium acidiphilum DSM 19497]